MLTVKIKGKIGKFPIDADIEAGLGVTALYGPSGAGKSSVLRAIAGLWRPKEGHISVDGKVLFDSSARINLKPEQRGLGIVFQAPLLFPHLNVARNLQFGMLDGSNTWREVTSMLDLEPLLTRMPRHLSGGEAQRVALGRALLANPQIILLDEPLTGLDEDRRQQVLPYLERLRDETKVPVVYVSHRRDEIMRLADLVFLMENGVVTEELTPPEFDEAYPAIEYRRTDMAW